LARTDLLASAFWLALGLLTIQQSWVMDRLESQGADPWSAPGLVPGLIGAVLTLLGALLMLRALRHPAAPQEEAEEPEETEAEAREGRWRLLAVLALCLVFTVGLLGHGLPFWLASAVFIAAFIVLLSWRARQAGLVRVVGFACAYGLVMGAAIHFLFERLFLVRLP
jgi:hypothetical protein